MVRTSEILEPYFSHDLSTRTSKEIILIIDDLGFEGYGLFWAVVEFMHKNELRVGEERFIVGKQYEDKIKSILNDYDLFHIEDGVYISERIQRNLQMQEDKSKSAKNAVETRWIMSAYKKAYKEVFDIDPVLEQEEIETLKSYSKKIKDFKEVLPNIVFTLSKIEFTNGITTKARSNWLLKDGNLGKIYNGQYGKLRDWKKEKESRNPKPIVEEEEQNTFDVNTFDTKAAAIEFIIKQNNNTRFATPQQRELMNKFDITQKELESARASYA